MMVMFFDRFEKRIADIDTISSCMHTEESNTLSVLGYNIPTAAKYAAFRDLDGDLQLFEIRQRLDDPITKQTELYAEHAYYELLTDFPIEDIRPTNVQAGFAMTQALAGTRWQPGTIIPTGTASTHWYYQPRTQALMDIETVWNVRLKPRITVSGSKINGRYIDITSRTPIWRGKRFEIGKDILSAQYTLDDRNVITAIIGRGKGEETGDGYGRRIDFSDVAWSKANGDPADKPAGQNYIEDIEATAQYGILGTRPRVTTKVYSDITEPAALLAATWADLQSVCQPILSCAITVMDLERIGFPHEAARYGDEVAFIADGIRARSTIVSVVREYAQRGQDVFQLGALSDSMAANVAKINRSIGSISTMAAAGAAIAQQSPSLLQGYLDTMITRILSTGTKLYTDPTDGGLMLESDDGNSAMKLMGNGLLIAPAKIGDTWQWRTAISGRGQVIDETTTGILHATLIKILGTDQFYWDASNIFIINPDDSQMQIRIGRYDGIHYGIGYTQDGGGTWQNAIGFDGVNFTVISTAINENSGKISSLESAIPNLATKNELTTKFASLELDSTGMSVRIGSIESAVTGAQSNINTLNQFKATQETLIRNDILGVHVTVPGYKAEALVAPDGLHIKDNTGAENSYFIDGKMYTKNAEITNTLKLGGFQFVKYGSGRMSVKWVG